MDAKIKKFRTLTTNCLILVMAQYGATYYKVDCIRVSKFVHFPDHTSQRSSEGLISKVFHLIFLEA